jgi:hypothetical protein
LELIQLRVQIAQKFFTEGDSDFAGEFERFDSAGWKNDLPCSCSVLCYNCHIYNYNNNS